MAEDPKLELRTTLSRAVVLAVYGDGDQKAKGLSVLKTFVDREMQLENRLKVVEKERDFLSAMFEAMKNIDRTELMRLLYSDATPQQIIEHRKKSA